MSDSRPAVPAAIATVFRHELDSGERAALLSWTAFTATFAAVRGITYSIRAGRGPFRNLSPGGEHLHHYLWGIAMLAGVGGEDPAPLLLRPGAQRGRGVPLARPSSVAQGAGRPVSLVDHPARDIY
ncbi:MAG TPA: hypothetical protein VF371_08745 [Candidatus Limnocylindrales bacterium]|jgi:hypothetical protein